MYGKNRTQTCHDGKKNTRIPLKNNGIRVFLRLFEFDGGDGLFTGKYANRKNGSIQD